MPSVVVNKKILWIIAAALIGAAVFQPIVGYAQFLAPAPLSTTPPTNQAPPTNTATPPTNTAEKDITKTAGKSAKCNAGWVTCAIMEVFQWIALSISYMIGYVAGLFISLAAAAIQIIINAGSKITSNPLVTEGFKITLNVTNLGFVLAIIVIAYTTIFRISGYETKKLLKNLIIAALLVNFSFTIAGASIDFSNVFGNFFLNAITPAETGKFADNLANSLNVHKLANIKPDKIDSIPGTMEKLGAGYLGIFASAAATVIFSVVLMITFFAVAVMLLIRYVYLIILLILMPAAWLMWIFPGFSKHWSAWWSKFFQWNLFYPAVMFFLYLAIISSQKVGEVVNQGSVGNAALKGAATLANVSTDIMVAFLQIFVQVGILFGGLIAANKLGIDGSAGALKMASGFKNWAIGATGKAAGRITGVPYLSERTGAFGTKAAAKGLANVLNRVTPRLAGGAVSALNTFASRKNEVEEFRKGYLASLDEGQFAERQKRVPASPVEAAAMLAESIQRKKTKGLTEGITEKEKNEMLKRDDVINAIADFPREQQEEMVKGFAQTERMKKYANAAQKTGNPELVKEVLSVDPQLAKELVGKEVKDVAAGLSADKALQLSDGALSNPQVVLNLSEGVIGALMRSLGTTQTEKLSATIKNAVSEPLQNIAKNMAETQRELRFAPKQQTEILKANLRSLVQEQRRLYESASENQRRAYDRLQIINQKIGSITNLR